LSPAAALYEALVDVAKSGDHVAAGELLTSAIRDGCLLSCHHYGAVVIACTNVADLRSAELWLALMGDAGHSVCHDTARSIAKTSLNYALACRDGRRAPRLGASSSGECSSLEEVGRWLRGLHSEGVLPLSLETIVEVLDVFEEAEVHSEMSAWAGMAFLTSVQGLLGCDSSDGESM